MLSEIYFLENMMKERQQAFEREAMRIRLIRQSKTRRSFSLAAVFDRIADILIQTGDWMHANLGARVPAFGENAKPISKPQ